MVARALLLTSTAVVAVTSSARAEEAGEPRALCSDKAVETAARALGEDGLRKLVGMPSLEEERDQTCMVDHVVGAFYDAGCHDLLVTTRCDREAVAEPHVFRLHQMGSAPTFVELLELDGVGELAAPREAVDFDRDGRDEVFGILPHLSSGGTEPEVGLAQLYALRGRSFPILWSAVSLFDEANDEGARPPFTRRETKVRLEDLDGDGVEEIVTETTTRRYSDRSHESPVGPSTSLGTEVYRFDGAEHVRWSPHSKAPRPAATVKSLSRVPDVSLPPGVVTTYRARLSAADHIADGRPLKVASQVIRRDRLNVHSPGSGADREDTRDGLYHSAKTRGRLVELLVKAILPADQERIMKGTPLVEVVVFHDRVTVKVLSE